MLNEEKFEELVLAIAEHPNVTDLGLTKLWKLIYFIDTRALRERGHSITGSEFIKYEHGPVPSRGERVLKKLKKSGAVTAEQRDHGTYKQCHVSPVRPPNPAIFTREENAIIGSICQSLGNKTAKYLSEASHLEPAWKYATIMDKLDPILMHYGDREDPEGL